MDFKDFVKKHCTNLKTSVTGQRINWLKVKWIQVRRDNQRSVFVNYSFDDNQFQEIQVQKTTRKQKGVHNTWPNRESDLKRCYDTKLPISIQKKNDLVNLCSKETIPEELNSYYESLPTSSKEKDFVPMESDEEDTDIE
ncbi:hypothetical protein DPMN_116022 [Dreissena polymorpha]|uniref:Uncharacterized protein n=1 Tax=Dreissena polymorpha TaxID=45954 RepID=A0A9D3YG32_DREPO|nr:hypothetical protein DPMN_085613 [Dreissena polymorpha]KAH3842526.1 hypothetical protein DPMN_116022 [Dreissena polymorpha]